MVIFASSLGTVFEWYDFYIYGASELFSRNISFHFPLTSALLSRYLAFSAWVYPAAVRRHTFRPYRRLVGRKFTFM